MTGTIIELKKGLKVGEETHKKVELGDITAGDIIDANQEAEQVRVVMVDGKPEATVIVSPNLSAVHLLRRQIKKIGSLDGPIAYDVMRKLSSGDFERLLAAADQIAAAVAKEAVQRGRGDARPEGD